MIGANNNPMSLFVPGGGGEAFNRGLAIGDANSPASSVAQALQATVDRYHQQMDAQQQQQNSLALAQGKGAIDLGNEKALVDYKRQGIGPDPDANGPTIMKDPTTGKFFYANHTPDATTGQMKVAWTPVTNSPPQDEMKAYENALIKPLNDAMAAQQGQGSGDKRAQAISVLKNAGKVVNEDTINRVMKQL